MSEEKPAKAKKPKKEVVVSPALIEAVKRSSEGKASQEDMQLVVAASPILLSKARVAAGLKSARGGRSRVDVWVSVNGTTAKRNTFGWRDFGTLKKSVATEGKEIRMSLVPAGVRPGGSK